MSYATLVPRGAGILALQQGQIQRGRACCAYQELIQRVYWLPRPFLEASSASSESTTTLCCTPRTHRYRYWHHFATNHTLSVLNSSVCSSRLFWGTGLLLSVLLSGCTCRGHTQQAVSYLYKVWNVCSCAVLDTMQARERAAVP